MRAAVPCLLAVLALACKSDSVGSRQEPLFGDITYADDCTSDMTDMLDKGVAWGRIAAVSQVYEECIEEAFRTGMTRDGWSIGPYMECRLDPFVDEALDGQIGRAIAAARTLNDVAMTCTGGDDAIAATGQDDGYDHINAESMKWGDWMAAWAPDPCWRSHPMSCAPNGDIGWPMSSIADATWHEAAHTHHYSHGANDQENALPACGYDEEDGWNFQRNTAPYIIGLCLGYVIHRSGEVCRLTDCGPDALHILDDLDETGCNCIADPRLTGGPASGPVGADLTVVSASATYDGNTRAVAFTIANRGAAGALDFEVDVLRVAPDGTTSDPAGVPYLIETVTVASLAAGEERALSVPLEQSEALWMSGAQVVVDGRASVAESDETNNILVAPLVVPNLRISEVDARIGRERLEGTVLVRNTSGRPSQATRLEVALAVDGHRTGWIPNLEVGFLLPGGIERVPFSIELPSPRYWGSPDSERIGPERHQVWAEVDPYQRVPESDETDNEWLGPIAWPDLSVTAGDLAAADHHYGAHHLEIGYQVDNARTAYANSFAHEVRLEDAAGTVLTRSRVDGAELAPAASLTRDAVAIDFTDEAGSLTCNGHTYNEYLVRVAVDDPDKIGELREDNNQVAHRFVTTDEAPPVVAVDDPGLQRFEVIGPDETVSFVVSATASDPEGDPLTLTWSSDDVANQDGTITPGPGPGQATVTMTARALSALRCQVPGARTLVLVHVTATADDCILEASATRTIAVELQIVDSKLPIPEERICELAYRGLDELELALLRLRFIDPLCPWADPATGRDACMGLSWLNLLADRWASVPSHTLPPAELKTLTDLHALVSSYPDTVIASWDKELALAELSGMLAGKRLTGGAITALVLEATVIDSVQPVFAPIKISKGWTGKTGALGFSLTFTSAAPASGPLGLRPTTARPATPTGTVLVDDLPVMILTTPGAIPPDATISYRSPRGTSRLQLIGFTAAGPIDLTTSWSASTRTVTGRFAPDLRAVAVTRRR